MARDKKSFLLYTDLISVVEELSDEEAGLLLKHTLMYVNDMNPTPPNRLIKLIFEPIKLGIESYFKSCRIGEYSHLWKGGITPKNHADRCCAEYKNWRDLVFKKDNYTCQVCGKRGGIIHAHHILLFSEYKELRFDISNGTTLCEKCHNKIHSKK